MRGTDGAEKSSESRSAAVPRFRQPQCGSSCLVVENCCCNNTVKKFETSVNAFLSLPALVTMKLSGHHILRTFLKLFIHFHVVPRKNFFPTYVKRHSENFPARCCINPSIHKSIVFAFSCTPVLFSFKLIHQVSWWVSVVFYSYRLSSLLQTLLAPPFQYLSFDKHVQTSLVTTEKYEKHWPLVFSTCAAEKHWR